MTRRLLALLPLLPLAALPMPAAAGDTAFFLMSGAQIDCLAKNAESYLASGEDTLFIRPEDCGTDRTGATVSFLDMTQNAAPDIRIVEDRNVPDAIVVLSRDDLACIARQALPAADLVAFYPQGCRVEVRAP